ELVATIDRAPKLNVTNRDFWMRAADACRSAHLSFNPKQLTALVNAFMQGRHYDRHLLSSLCQA
ncbi:unnamed protein product, partial [Amoebophrya sp. A25]